MKSTFDLLQCAFAEGISYREYRMLVAILKAEGGMTLRAVADAVALLGYKDYFEIYNDALGIHEHDLSSYPQVTEQVRQKLNDCGYQSWLEED